MPKGSRPRMSRKRAQAAFCWLCRGWTSHPGCLDPTCPFYAFLPEDKQERGEAVLWWKGSTSAWRKGYAVARGETCKVELLEGDEDPCEADVGDGESDDV